MAVKINLSYQKDDENQRILHLLKPVLDDAKVRTSKVFKPYKHTYITINNLPESK